MIQQLHITLLITSLFLSSCGSTTSASFSLRGSYSKTAVESQSIVTSGSPKSMAINVHAYYLGTKADCTDLKPMLDYGIGSEGYDLYRDPLLFSSNPAPDTYRCIALKIKDTITVRMNSIALSSWPDVCQENVDYDKDLYLASSSQVWKDVSGNPVTATGTETTPSENLITLFATTDSSQAISGSLGLASSQVFTLSSPITLPAKITFYIDYTEGVSGTSVCKLSTGTMGFR